LKINDNWVYAKKRIMNKTGLVTGYGATPPPLTHTDLAPGLHSSFSDQGISRDIEAIIR
jgi:hypothetical protein